MLDFLVASHATQIYRAKAKKAPWRNVSVSMWNGGETPLI